MSEHRQKGHELERDRFFQATHFSRDSTVLAMLTHCSKNKGLEVPKRAID